MSTRIIIIFTFICLMASDTIEYMSVSMGLSTDATYITAALKIISLIFLLFLTSKIRWRARMPAHGLLFFKMLMGWNVITIVRGAFTAENYWDWKYLILYASFSFLIPCAIIVGLMFEHSRNLFKLIVTKIFLYGFIVIPLTVKIDPERELYARGIVISVCFFILLSPYFKRKWQLLTFLVATATFILSIDFRANVIRITLATLIIFVYYARKYVPLKWIKFACLTFFITPLLFLFLGVTGQYNIFKPSDNIDKYEFSYDDGTERNIALDTRTFLYQEVFATMQGNNSFVWGEGGAGTYKTEYFDDSVDYNKGRYGTEVGFLNVLLYSGILGVLFYAVIIFSAGYYAVNYSNNFLCKMLALFLAFRWVLFFIEDFTRYDVNYYFLWIAVGLCFSKDFRSLSDAELMEYFNFKKMYIKHLAEK